MQKKHIEMNMTIFILNIEICPLLADSRGVGKTLLSENREKIIDRTKCIPKPLQLLYWWNVWWFEPIKRDHSGCFKGKKMYKRKQNRKKTEQVNIVDPLITILIIYGI